MSQIDDVEAVHSYFLATPSKTPAAETIRVNFLNWYEKAGWWDKNLSPAWYDDARTRRNQFNLANATTPAETAQVQNNLAKGLTTEQMQGKSRPKVDVKTGKVGTQIHDTPLNSDGQPTLDRVLKKGLHGDDVKTWQTFLGLTPPTGYFDSLTDTKTRAFQKAQHLTVDGAVGKMSWAKAFPIIATPQMTPDGSPAAVFAPADATANINQFAPAQSAAPKFAPSPASAPATSFAPSPAAKRAGVAKAKGKGAPSSSSSASDPAAAIPSAKATTAGIASGLAGMSTGAKVVGAVAALALTAGVVMGHDKKQHGHHHR